MTRQKIIELIREAAQQAGFKIPGTIGVVRSEGDGHGDYATNFALQIAKTIKLSPKQIANTLRTHILNLQPGFFEKIEIAEPGFINFFLSQGYLQNQVRDILKQKGKFGQLKIGKGQKANVESISANPTGSLHIGNGRNAFSGDVIANVLEKAGYKVVREYFVNNAKSNTQIKLLGKTALGKGTVYLSDRLQSQIVKLKPKLAKITDEGEAGHLLAQEVQKDNKDFIEKKLKIKFDNWISEEDFCRKNKIEKIFAWLQKENLVYQKDGAWWLKTSQFGDTRDWVVIRETGVPTYLLSDIAYHKDKFDRGFSRVIDIWGADHQAHVAKMKAVAKILGYQGSLDILILQLVTLRGKEKISKRKGSVITLEDLVNEIGLDVARFIYLQKSLATHMEIDLALAKEQSDKNPVFYVQYAHARICSILKKAKGVNGKAQNLELLKHPSELSLIKELIRFLEIIDDTAKDYQVQRLPQYAMGLATAFHQFYRDCHVLSENKNLSRARLALALATKIVLKNTLELTGISAPVKM